MGNGISAIWFSISHFPYPPVARLPAPSYGNLKSRMRLCRPLAPRRSRIGFEDRAGTAKIFELCHRHALQPSKNVGLYVQSRLGPFLRGIPPYLALIARRSPDLVIRATIQPAISHSISLICNSTSELSFSYSRTPFRA